jgi:CRP-like cAMP-binding protein
MRYNRQTEIYGEGEQAQHVFKVISGAVRTFTIDIEGRRQIEGFHLPGDVFGFETDTHHRFSAEALTDAEIVALPRAPLERAAAEDRDTAHALWALAANELRQTREHMLVLGRKGAAERVVAFLLEMAARSKSDTLHLPMSRTDIADYLGLTIETVSRSFSRLERARAIALDGARQVTFRDKARLESFAA